METFILWSVFLSCMWIITDKHIPTGITVTVGLLLIAVGCLASLDETAFTMRAFTIRGTGSMVVAWGIIWRFHGAPRWSRWYDLILRHRRVSRE